MLSCLCECASPRARPTLTDMPDLKCSQVHDNTAEMQRLVNGCVPLAIGLLNRLGHPSPSVIKPLHLHQSVCVRDPLRRASTTSDPHMSTKFIRRFTSRSIRWTECVVG
uniref:Uncharacterized protein n=1 Tax=Mesocestoides corti TaxID=53468 RepID=A0A5K3FZ83_MESCO